MVHVPVEAFLNRVFTSEEKIPFSFVDPYVHMGTSRYLEMFLNHRVAAPEEQVGISTIEMAREMKLGLVFYETTLRFLIPSILGEKIQIASWATAVHDTGFELMGMIVGVKDRRVRAIVRADLRSVNLQTGKPIPFPSHLPCEQDGPFEHLPTSDKFFETLSKLPKDWAQFGRFGQNPSA